MTNTIIIDEIYNKSVPKPVNFRPGYDLDYVIKDLAQANCYNYNRVENICKIEKKYDDLAIIKLHETP